MLSPASRSQRKLNLRHRDELTEAIPFLESLLELLSTFSIFASSAILRSDMTRFCWKAMCKVEYRIEKQLNGKARCDVRRR
jgi:hypothetical protein